MTATFTVRDLPISERPRERLFAVGPEALSQQELLACVLGRGVAGDSVLVVAQRLLERFDTLQDLADASCEQLASVRGVGAAKAAQLKAAFELGRRSHQPSSAAAALIDTPEAAAELVRAQLIHRKEERVLAILLDARHRLIRVRTIAVGTLTASLVHPRELFRDAIAASAAAVIVCHNHPSGDPEPSAADLELTAQLHDAGALLGIEVLDHLIIARQGMVSLRSRGAFNATPMRGKRNTANRLKERG